MLFFKYMHVHKILLVTKSKFAKRHYFAGGKSMKRACYHWEV